MPVKRAHTPIHHLTAATPKHHLIVATPKHHLTAATAIVTVAKITMLATATITITTMPKPLTVTAIVIVEAMTMLAAVTRTLTTIRAAIVTKTTLTKTRTNSSHLTTHTMVETLPLASRAMGIKNPVDMGTKTTPAVKVVSLVTTRTIMTNQVEDIQTVGILVEDIQTVGIQMVGTPTVDIPIVRMGTKTTHATEEGNGQVCICAHITSPQHT